MNNADMRLNNFFFFFFSLRIIFLHMLVFVFARNESPSEVPNLLGKAVDELKHEKQEG